MTAASAALRSLAAWARAQSRHAHGLRDRADAMIDRVGEHDRMRAFDEVAVEAERRAAEDFNAGGDRFERALHDVVAAFDEYAGPSESIELIAAVDAARGVLRTRGAKG